MEEAHYTTLSFFAAFREERQQNALSRHRKKTCRTVRCCGVDKVSRDFLFRNTFPSSSLSVLVVAQLPQNPRYWSLERSDTNETNGKGEWNLDGISFSLKILFDFENRE